MADGENFMECSDPKAGDCSVEAKKRFLAIINWSIKRVPAMRPSREGVTSVATYCTAGNFCGVQFLQIVDLYYFAGLIFVDACTYTNCVLYN